MRPNSTAFAESNDNLGVLKYREYVPLSRPAVPPPNLSANGHSLSGDVSFIKSRRWRRVLTWRVEVGILAHLALHFLPLLLEVHEGFTVAKVFSFDFALCLAKDTGVTEEDSAVFFPDLFELMSLLRSQPAG